MKKGAPFTFSKAGSKHIKLYVYITLPIVILLSIVLFQYFSYKSLLKDFKVNFECNEFSAANNILVSRQNFNLFKQMLLNADLSKYFSEKLNTISKDMEEKKLTEETVTNIINEIKRYDTDYTIPTNLNIDESFDSAVDLFKDGQYIQAYNIFSKIKYTDSNYSSSIAYLSKCKEKIKESALTESTKLCKEGNYTEALDLLDSSNELLGYDDKLTSKIYEVEKYYLDSLDNTTTVSNNNSALITTANINNLSLKSSTSYLIQVDTTNQKTNIYKGQQNKWNLEKSFTCSSGTSSESTPKGVYTIKDKGDWFFSQKYKQGGKYWVQFYGDYLFHSLPYAEDKNTIVDYTLGTPASHGCIRLTETDAKWIYDNIPRETKVIIQ